MEPHVVFCHNPGCPSRGKVNRGNIGVHRGSLSIKRADSECDSKSYSLFIRLIPAGAREFDLSPATDIALLWSEKRVTKCCTTIC